MIRTNAAIIGSILKNIRESDGYTLRNMQESTAISYSRVRRIEAGERHLSVEECIALSDIYGIDIYIMVCKAIKGDILQAHKDIKKRGDSLQAERRKIYNKNVDFNACYQGTTIPNIPYMKQTIANHYQATIDGTSDWIKAMDKLDNFSDNDIEEAFQEILNPGHPSNIRQQRNASKELI